MLKIKDARGKVKFVLKDDSTEPELVTEEEKELSEEDNKCSEDCENHGCTCNC